MTLPQKRSSTPDLFHSEVKKVAFIGSFLPRKCGIATFTHDLHMAVSEAFPGIKGIVLAMNDRPEGYQYADKVRFEIEEQDPGSYLRAADYINASGVSVMCVQHEYGIYGGECGSMLLPFLKALRVPIVTTLHTILQQPSNEQRRILTSILSISSRVITMAEKGAELLSTVYGANMDKVHIVAHGIPEMEFPDTDKYKVLTELSGKKVVLTFGLLSPNKGIEYAIRAMKPVVDQFPDAVYVVLGQTHPGIIRDQGESYRHGLEHLAQELGIRENVIFIDKFVDLPLLKKYIAACDVYLTPYLHEAQITSGTLSYAFGMGTVVVSTPYWHAAELLADGRGKLVPFRDSPAMADSLIEVLGDHRLKQRMKQVAFDYGRTMTWSQTARLYMNAFEESLTVRKQAPLTEPFRSTLPDVNLSHLRRMTDDVGVLHFARFAVPNRVHGYNTDDVTRALVLLTQMRRNGFEFTADMKSMMTTYVSFILDAYDPSSGRFLSHMTFNRTWSGGDLSEDCHGRVLQCLGASFRFGIHLDCAVSLFEESYKVVTTFTSPRSWAYALLGLRDYLMARDNHEAKAVQKELVGRLIDMYKKNSTEEWKWYVSEYGVDQIIYAQAVVATAKVTNDSAMMDIGEESIDWLYQRLMMGDIYYPISHNGGFTKEKTRAHFNGLPLEAGAMVLACASTWTATGNEEWRRKGRAAFDWFMGKNLLGKPIYDAETNGCGDESLSDRFNMNQGAESILAFLQALVALKKEETAPAPSSPSGQQTPHSFSMAVAQFPVVTKQS